MKDKKFLFISLLMLLGALIFLKTNSYSHEDLYGLWVGNIDDQKVISLKFNEDNTCVLRLKDLLTNTESRMAGDFEVGFLKRPIPLTIRNISQLDHPLHTIIRFERRNLIRIASFSSRWRVRPTSFSEAAWVRLELVQGESRNDKE